MQRQANKLLIRNALHEIEVGYWEDYQEEISEEFKAWYAEIEAETDELWEDDYPYEIWEDSYDYGWDDHW